MKTKLIFLLCIFTFFSLNAQTVYNNFGETFLGNTYLDTNSNDYYLIYTDLGTIKKTNVNSANNTVTNYIAGLKYPRSVSILNNKLYVLEVCTGVDIYGNPIPNTGKLSYYDLSLPSLNKVTLYNNLNAPLNMTLNNNYCIIDENSFNTNGDVTQQIISKITISGTLTKTTLLTRTNNLSTPESYIFNDLRLAGTKLYGNTYLYNYTTALYDGGFYEYDLVNSTITKTHTFVNNAPYGFNVNQNNYYFYSGPISNYGKLFKTPVNSNNISTIFSGLMYLGYDIDFYNLHFDSNGNGFIIGNSFNYDTMSDNQVLYKVAATQLLSTNNISKDLKTCFYPNPTKSTLNFSQELSEIKIVDMSGKQVLAAPSKTKTINLEKLPKGNYLITAKDKNGKTISKKFIKE